MQKNYECTVSLGSLGSRNRRFFWVKGVRWADDSLVIDFSSDQCFVPGEVASCIPLLMDYAAELPNKHWGASVHECFSPESASGNSDLVEKYAVAVRELIRIYGSDGLMDVLLGRTATPLEEVPGND